MLKTFFNVWLVQKISDDNGNSNDGRKRRQLATSNKGRECENEIEYYQRDGIGGTGKGHDPPQMTRKKN
jgi:hypothetical protein